MSAQQEPNPYESVNVTPFQQSPPPRRLPLAIALAIVVIVIGGALSGGVMTWHPILGAIALWPTGALGGYLSRRLTVGPSRIAGWCLVAACVVALLTAEVCWLRWKTVQGEQRWGTSIQLLPTYFRDYRDSALIEACCAAFGAFSAYSTAGRRYRLVREYID